MSGFAALTGFEGDSDDVLAAQKRRDAKQKAAAAAEAAATRARFDELKASAGATNWADSDDDDDSFFGKPPGLGGPPGLQVKAGSRCMAGFGLTDSAVSLTPHRPARLCAGPRRCGRRRR